MSFEDIMRRRGVEPSRGENPTIRPGEWFFQNGDLRVGPFASEEEAARRRSEIRMSGAPWLELGPASRERSTSAQSNSTFIARSEGSRSSQAKSKSSPQAANGS